MYNGYVLRKGGIPLESHKKTILETPCFLFDPAAGKSADVPDDLDEQEVRPGLSGPVHLPGQNIRRRCQPFHRKFCSGSRGCVWCRCNDP